MLVSEKHRNALKQALLKQDQRPVVENVDLYKEVGITPADYGYMAGNWEYWMRENAGPTYRGVTLTGAEVTQLRTVFAELRQITRSQAINTATYRSSFVNRLSQTAIDLFTKMGIRPIDLGVSNAEEWKNY
jgi:hypothetical protein